MSTPTAQYQVQLERSTLGFVHHGTQSERDCFPSILNLKQSRTGESLLYEHKSVSTNSPPFDSLDQYGDPLRLVFVGPTYGFPRPTPLSLSTADSAALICIQKKKQQPPDAVARSDKHQANIHTTDDPVGLVEIRVRIWIHDGHLQGTPSSYCMELPSITPSPCYDGLEKRTDEGDS